MHPRVLTTEAKIDALLEHMQSEPELPSIVEAVYRPESRLEFLMQKLSDGRRLLIPRENLAELKNATPAQAVDLNIGPLGTHVWWPQLDDGVHLMKFLEHRWGKIPANADEQHGVAA